MRMQQLMLPSSNRMVPRHSWVGWRENNLTNAQRNERLQNVSPDVRNAALNVRSSADGLLQAITNMRMPDSAFNSRVASSSDTNVLTAQTTNSNHPLLNQNLSVEVHQLAQSQQNQGTALNSTDLATTAGFAEGANQISITIGSTTTNIDFDVSATDTVRDVQNRIANITNNLNIGVRANVSSGNGQSTLSFEARNMNQDFTIGSTGAASTLGVENATRVAQEAQFTVTRNGIIGNMQTAGSNNVQLGFGTSAQLTGTGTADITTTRDEAGQAAAMRELVGAFNDFMRSSRDPHVNSRLQTDLQRAFRTSSSAFSQMGITMASNGTLNIDENRFMTGIANGVADNFMNQNQLGSNHGFLNRISSLAGEASANPERFVPLPQARPMFAVEMPCRCPHHSLLVTPQQMTMMHQVMNMGILFNALR